MDHKTTLKEQSKTPSHIDALRESELQSSIFRGTGARSEEFNFASLRESLRNESQIPHAVTEEVLHHIRGQIHTLGLENPGANIILSWLSALLRERGYSLGEGSLQSLELSLGDVELNIFHPVGLGAGANQNPEATSQRIAQRIKSQFAEKRVFQDEIIQAHNDGALEVLHLGAIDRPHDIFLTPDYLKIGGLPISGTAPAAGPARHAHVLLAHMIRFSHELQNHFAGDIRWGYVNTLFLPFIHHMDDEALSQFVQQILYEFAQLDVERGGLARKVTLDFDLDIPRQLAGMPALWGGGAETGLTYGEYAPTLRRFNELALKILARGDCRSNPFHSPRIIFHFNDPKTTWGSLHQLLMETAFKWGNPQVAVSYYQRDFGALGRLQLNDPDFLKMIQNPASMRGFSSSTLAINMPRLVHESGGRFEEKLNGVLDLAVSAHRQKRLFISRLMAYGNRGPLQFLRHKLVDNRPFLKIDQATQPMQVIGLAEAAALLHQSPNPSHEALGRDAEHLLKRLQQALENRNRIHKLNMFLTGAKSETVAYRFAYLDLSKFGQSYAPYILHPGQSHPIYTEGANILAFKNVRRQERFRIEGKLHNYLAGHSHAVFMREGDDDPSFYHKIYQEALNANIAQIQPAPDLNVCMACSLVFTGMEQTQCPACHKSMVAPYGYCQTSFSPVNTWCLGKRSEWKIRHRIDEYKAPVQTNLPW